MAERMVEVVGFKDPIGGGLYNMGVTDERIVRCRDCKYFDTRKCKSQWPFRLDGFCSWGAPVKEKEKGI